MANLHSLFGQELIQIADDANIWWQSSRRGARTAGGEDITAWSKDVKGCHFITSLLGQDALRTSSSAP